MRSFGGAAGRRRSTAIVVALGLAGCFSNSSGGGAGIDAGFDGSGFPEEGGTDAAPVDATMDSAVDSSIDVGIEAAVDSATPHDATSTTEAAVEAGPVEAGIDAPADVTATCDAGMADCGSGCISLTTDTNCGACNRSCFGNGCNSDGTCNAHVLLAAEGYVWEAVYANGAVYLMQVDGGPPTLYTLLRVPTNGGPTVVMDTQPTGNYPGGLATDGTNLYWTVSTGGVVTMWSLPLGAPAGTPRTQVFQPIVQPGHLRISGGNFYWNSTACPGTGIYMRPIAHPVFDSGQDQGVQIVTDYACSDVEVTSDAIYYSSNMGGALMTAPIAGGTPSTVTSTLTQGPGFDGFSVDGTYLYWTLNVSNAMAGVYQYTAGGTVAQVIPAAHGVHPLIVDGNTAYYAVGPIMYGAPKTGGTGTPLGTSSTAAPNQFVGADTNYVYAVTASGGPLVAIPR